MRSIEVSPYRESLQSEKVYLPGNVKLSILFSAHSDKDDMGDFSEFRRRIKRADIYIPEQYGWNRIMQANLNIVSKGEISKREVLGVYEEALKSAPKSNFATWNMALLDALYATNRTIALVDIPAGHRLVKEVAPEIIPSDLLKGDFEQACDYMGETIRKLSDSEAQRDIYILEHIGPVLDSTIKSSPRLQVKAQVNVLMTLGTLHAPIYDVLAEKTEEQRKKTGSFLPTASMGVIEGGYDPSSFLVMHFHPAIESQMDEEQIKTLKAKTVGIFLLELLLPKERAKILYQIVDRLSVSDIQALFNSAKSFLNKELLTQDPPVMGKISSILEELGTKK